MFIHYLSVFALCYVVASAFIGLVAGVMDNNPSSDDRWKAAGKFAVVWPYRLYLTIKTLTGN